MRKSTLVAFIVVASLLALGTLIQDYRFDKSLGGARASALDTDRQIGALQVALSDLRAAETGYLATGQGPDFWMRRATDLSNQIGDGLDQLRGSTASGDAHAAYDAAAAALGDLMGVDKRARDDIQSDQRFVASDLIFVDGLQAGQRIAASLATARDAEAKAADTRMAGVSEWRFGMNAVALVVVVAGLIIVGQAAPADPASEAAAVAQMIRDLPPAVKPATAPTATAQPKPAPLVPVPIVNLADTADLCVDLARVIDDRDIPALLDRAAKVLDAKGVIVWVADKAGARLRPSLTHGYSDKVITKMGALEVGADNVTSLSFRSMRAQSMNGGSPGAAGAIAVPLVTTAGCTGVLAAEVRDGKPTADMIALAKIIAAQFATLIAPTDAAEDVRAVEA